MTGSTRVALIGHDRDHAFAAVVASLPQTLVLSGGMVELAVTFDSTRIREAVSRARTAVVLVDPSLQTVLDTEQPTAVPVLAGETYAGSEGVDDFLAASSAVGGRSLLIEIEATVAPGAAHREDALLQLLRVADVADIHLMQDATVSSGPTAMIIDSTTTDGAPVTLTVRETTGEHGMTLIRTTELGTATVRLPDSTSARPATVEILDQNGASTLPTRYETSLRSLIRRALTGERTPPDLGRLTRAAQQASRLSRLS